ncbi:hypothetical protein [Chryseobacterium sediminis]|jgi:hypothetical protein|uniref:hypothetical protein n=1 Tax=Chryseobacterium sediminis TaxID=1679494 RepID=UPI00286529FC|nr:hypothetical protein [Chryseobacterium sediminis]MDR6461599.1 hypothetical protein [Chryseobacterium sediminis]
MKTTIYSFVLVVLALIAISFNQAEKRSVGAIGDVKYSILPPEKFKEENGDGWVLMDNQVPIVSSALNKKHGITEIPDVRGLFIRSLNLTRSDNKADCFFLEKKKQRLVGEYQSDTIKSHNHKYKAAKGNDVSAKGSWSQFAWDPKEYVSENYGGLETRPKNIALYTYIKIN